MNQQPNLSGGSDSTDAPRAPVEQYPSPAPMAEPPSSGGMFKGMGIGLLIVAILLGGYAGFAYFQGIWPFGQEREETETDQTTDRETYRNDAFGFQVDYPENLSPLNNAGAEIGLGLYNEYLREYAVPRETTTFFGSAESVSTTFQVSVFESFQREFAAFAVGHDVVPIESARTMTVDGRTAYLLEPFGVLGDACSYGRVVIDTNETPVETLILLSVDICTTESGPESGAPEPPESLSTTAEELLSELLASFRFTGTSEIPRHDAVQRFSSQHFTLSFDMPPGYVVKEDANAIKVAPGAYEEYPIGSDNSFLRIFRFGGTHTAQKAVDNFRNPPAEDVRQSTIIIDGEEFLRLDATRPPGTAAHESGPVTLIMFEASSLHISWKQVSTTEVINTILESMRFEKTGPALKSPFVLENETQYTRTYSGTATVQGSYSSSNISDGILSTLTCFEPTWPTRDLLPESRGSFCFENNDQAKEMLGFTDSQYSRFNGNANITISGFRADDTPSETFDSTTLLRVHNTSNPFWY